MKLTVVIAFALFVFLVSQIASAQTTTFQGKGWQAMTHKEKFACVLATIVWMDACKVPLSKSPNTYIAKIDEILSLRPDMQDKDVAAIFASVVYQNEPGSRQALQSLQISHEQLSR